MSPLDEDEQEVIVDSPMTANELAIVRRQRGSPEYVPQASYNPLHEKWTDTEVVVLAPFFGMTEPPTIEDIDTKFLTHPALEARPGRPYHAIGLETLARYCFRHKKPKWNALGIQISQRGGFQQLLQMHDLKPEK